MYAEVPYKRVQVGVNNKKRRFGKPWWNNQLTELWNNVCETERRWLKCNVKAEKSRFKSEYVHARKLFDREVQRAKRLYWYSCQKQLIEECNEGNDEFWKSIGRIGVGQSKTRRIPMEIVLEDGSITRDNTAVLDKWKHDFCSLLNVNADNGPLVDDSTALQNGTEPVEPFFNENITLFVVKKAIDGAKKGKACGIDAIPIEVSFLTCSTGFNVCFDKGIVPSSWSKCIIKPIPKSSTADPRDPLSYRGISLASSIYILYCSILNSRLSSWSETNGKLQGFSCADFGGPLPDPFPIKKSVKFHNFQVKNPK